MTDDAPAPPPETEGPAYRIDPAFVASERAMLEGWLEFHCDTPLELPADEEHARHNGHADVVRECTDGATGD